MFLFAFQDMSDRSFSSIIAGKEDKLEEVIDVEHGLLAKLEAYNVITSQHRKAIDVTLVMLLLACFKLNTRLFCEVEL